MAFTVNRNDGTDDSYTDGDDLKIWPSGLIQAQSEETSERTLYSPGSYVTLWISSGHTRIQFAR